MSVLDKKRKAIARRSRKVSAANSGLKKKVSDLYKKTQAAKKGTDEDLKKRREAFKRRILAKREEKEALDKNKGPKDPKDLKDPKDTKDSKTVKKGEERRKARIEAFRKRREEKKAEEKKKGVVAKSDAVLARIRAKVKAHIKTKGADVDENGTPIVGDGPKVQEELAPPVKKGGPETEAKPEPVVPDEEKKPADSSPPAKTEEEEMASVIVQVNDKLEEIYKREEVDKILKGELEDIKESLTSVSAKFKGITASGKERGLTKDELTAIVGFLAKVEAAYEKRMVGFETTAKVKDIDSFGAVISKVRVAVDVSNERAHEVLKAYNEKKVTARELKDSVREVKAAVEKWGVVESVVNLFKKEASVSSSEAQNTLKVVAFVQEMVEQEKIPAREITAQVKEYLNLSPVEFRTVAATMKRVKGSAVSPDTEYPERMHSTQAGGDPLSLEDCFND